jgi:hypothetical protein
VFHHNSITNQQVRMLTLSQNRQQQLFCIKKTKKFQLIFTFLVMKFHFRLFRGTNTNKKKILPGFVKHTLVK